MLIKQVCGFADHVCAKSHWSKGPSLVSCPIDVRSAEIEVQFKSVYYVNKIQGFEFHDRSGECSKNTICVCLKI